MEPQRSNEHRHEGIAGLRRREPVGAALSVGTKGDKGNPTETDRFFLKDRRQRQRGSSEIKERPNHPAFTAFNALPPEKRQVIRGRIVHGEQARCFAHSVGAYFLGSTWPQWPKKHPRGRPVCSGDGIRATRLYGIGADGAEDWRDIPCPNRACEYRQGKVKQCKASALLYFRIEWPDGNPLPTPLCSYASHGWETTENLAGFFAYLYEQAAQMRIENPMLFGFPFTLTLSRATNPAERTSWPVVDISPGADPLAFFKWQREQLELAGGNRLTLTGAVSEAASVDDPEEADAIAIDFAAIVPGKGLPLAPAGPGLEQGPEDAETGAEVEIVPPGASSAAAGEPCDCVGCRRGETDHGLVQRPVPGPRDAGVAMRARIQSAALARGIDPEHVGSVIGGPLASLPGDLEHEALRKIKNWRKDGGR